MNALEYIPGNRITLLKDGAEFFPALLAAIDAAVVDIRIETYIFRNDATGEIILRALTAAAARGVKVRVLIDGVGSRETPSNFFYPMRKAGAHLQVFRPDRQFLNISKSRLRRNHRKIALIDGKVGFVGGINLIDDMTGSMSPHPRYDYAVQIEGPVLASIYPTVHVLWRLVAWRRLRRRDLVDEPVPVSRDAVGPHNAAFVVRDNFRNRRAIEKLYRNAIVDAKKSVLISSPYFLPGRRFRHILVAAAKRGVDVTLLLQGRADHPLLQMATRALYAQLLGAGIAICEYEKSMLHGKVVVIDDEWATVGSSNLDPFSLFLNREANIVVKDHGFAQQLHASVMAEIEQHATRCHAQDWLRRPLLERAKSWMAYGFARWVVGMMGVAKQWN